MIMQKNFLVLLSLLFGLVGIFSYQVWLWIHDRQRIVQYLQMPSLPDLLKWVYQPKISILVAAWKEKENIHTLVGSFRALRYPNKELILCAGGGDGTIEEAKSLNGPDLIILEQKQGEGKQRALKRSFDFASGEIIYLTDADCRLNDTSFELLVYPIVSGEEKAVSGRAEPLREQLESPFVISQFAAHLYSNLSTPRYSPGLLGRNCAVHRSGIIQSNGLGVPAPTGTDYILAKQIAQAGIRIRQVTQSRVQTGYETSISAYLNQQRRWQMNILLYGWRYKDRSHWFCVLLTTLIGLTMIVSLPLVIFYRGWFLILWILFFTFALVSRLRYLWIAYQVKPSKAYRRAVLYQPFYLLLDFIAWSMPILTMTTSRQRETW